MEFLSVEDVVRLHYAVPQDAPDDVDRGIHVLSGPQAALERCRWGPFEDPAGPLAERGALLLRGIIQDHPFLNANKRTGYLALETFLRLNEMRLAAPPAEKERVLVLVAAGGLRIPELTDWIGEHMEGYMEREG